MCIRHHVHAMYCDTRTFTTIARQSEQGRTIKVHVNPYDRTKPCRHRVKFTGRLDGCYVHGCCKLQVLDIPCDCADLFPFWGSEDAEDITQSNDPIAIRNASKGCHWKEPTRQSLDAWVMFEPDREQPNFWCETPEWASARHDLIEYGKGLYRCYTRAEDIQRVLDKGGKVDEEDRKAVGEELKRKWKDVRGLELCLWCKSEDRSRLHLHALLVAVCAQKLGALAPTLFLSPQSRGNTWTKPPTELFRHTHDDDGDDDYRPPSPIGRSGVPRPIPILAPSQARPERHNALPVLYLNYDDASNVILSLPCVDPLPPQSDSHPEFPTHDAAATKVAAPSSVGASAIETTTLSHSYGAHHRTVLVAAQIVANNAFNGYLALDKKGTQPVLISLEGILIGGKYFFIVPGDDFYPTVPSFQDWQFPHDKLPDSWPAVAPTEAAQAAQCVITRFP
ncbi:hypothetical protein B0H63DRAFT_551562 [Podospora didyma]|uniref:Uncharacterized protein n=1 Tax=Podospora didyma TaxID=330526 RepID=A0AAE0KB11_9PEZI|nr:hypothetical protein B0H63DRAFT_551562 [Podospora didyma]